MHFGAEEAIRSFGTLGKLYFSFISRLVRELLDKVSTIRTDGYI